MKICQLRVRPGTLCVIPLGQRVFGVGVVRKTGNAVPVVRGLSLEAARALCRAVRISADAQ